MQVTIVGAGPVGCCLALLLSRHGHTISIYERDQELEASTSSKSINITLSDRGLYVLKKVIPDIDDRLLQYGTPATGRVVHNSNGSQATPTSYGKDGEALLSLTRNAVTSVLRQELTQHKNIKVYFDHQLIRIDSRIRTCFFRRKGNEGDIPVESDLIVGADGVHSAVRSNIQKRNALCYLEQKKHKHAYIEFHIPVNTKLEVRYLHMWPRGDFLMLALPNKDGSFCGNLFMPWDDLKKVMTSKTSLLELWGRNFPDVMDIIDQEAFVGGLNPSPDFKPNCLTSVKCEPYHFGNNIVLVGDAAHGVVPFYGQGMNAGFQDCIVLTDILNSHSHAASPFDLGAALQAFSDTSCKNGHAIADLALEHYGQLRSGNISKKYHLRRVMDRFLNFLFPDSWPNVYRMVAFTQIPYERCLQERRRQDNILTSLTYAAIAIPVLSVLGVAAWLVCSLNS